MINNLGFRINKYLKTSIVISIIDILIFYVIGRLYNDMTIFNLIVSNWKYLSLYISAITIFIYMFDVLFFFDRKRKYKLLFIFTEPFLNWKKYLYKNLKIRKEENSLKFYSNIYKQVSNNSKIMAIMEDEILIRDIYVHLITTNIIIISVIFVLEKISLCIYFIVIFAIFLTAILVNLLYRQFLNYYISEIYVEYLELNENNKGRKYKSKD